MLDRVWTPIPISCDFPYAVYSGKVHLSFSYNDGTRITIQIVQANLHLIMIRDCVVCIVLICFLK